jgi:hypothetical protein
LCKTSSQRFRCSAKVQLDLIDLRLDVSLSRYIRSWQTSIIVLMLTAGMVFAQQDTTPKERLFSPAHKRANLDGDSHDSYVIRVCHGQQLSLRIKDDHDPRNSISYVVSRSPDFFRKESSLVNVGKDGTADLDKTGNYYVYVFVEPKVGQEATDGYTRRVSYTLKVKLKGGNGRCVPPNAPQKTRLGHTDHSHRSSG